MYDKVIQTIQKYNLIEATDKILVAVSGGPDSMALLHIMKKAGYLICVVHVNHGLRESADEEEAYVKDYCEKQKIPFFCKKVHLRECLDGMGIEEAGRKVRYDFFEEVAEKEHCSKIATAHNSNDNAETVLMNMMRGTGLKGLTGIKPKQGKIIRPLLEVNRKEIEAYCQENQIMAKHDESNDELFYTRNKIRLALIPYLEKNINQNIVNNINRMAQILSEEENFLERETQKAFEDCLLEANEKLLVCNLKSFNKLDIVIRRRLILKFIIKILGNAKDIEKVHVDDIVKLCENNIGGKYLTPNKYIKISVGKGKIQFEKIE